MSSFKINNLTKSYNDKPILDNLNLEVKENEIVTIMGKSGAGKTTLLFCILGFIFPDSGEILLDDKDLTHVPIEQRHIAYMPQDYGLFPHLSVRDNILFSLSIRGEKKEIQDEKVLELLNLVDLPKDLILRGIGNLSGGEKQRVALARAFAMQPRLFLLDEPLSAIDVDTKTKVGTELRALIKELNIPAIVICHVPEEAELLGDRIIRLEEGKLDEGLPD